ncbi:MAG TPA: site-specific integrase [Bryobacteraceae bacterium]
MLIDGKKHSYTTGTKDYNEAKKQRAKAIRELEQGRPPEDSGRKRFEPTADAYIRHREATVSEGTVRLEKERLKPLKRGIGNVRLKDITARTIRSYQATRAAEVSNKTVNLETDLLRGILKAEGQWRRLAEDVKRLPKPKASPGRALSPEETLRLFTAAESKEEWFVACHATLLAYDTGMRGVEVRHLKLADVDIDARKLTIRRSKGNNGLFRTVILTNDALKAMLKLLERAERLNACEPEHYVFPYKIRNGAGYDPTRPAKGWRTAWRNLRKAAGLGTGNGSFRFHDLRHTFITAHAEAGTPLPVVQAQAGQLSEEMTRLYTHISQRAMQEAAERFTQRKAEALAEAKRKLAEEQACQKVN